ncbi:MAG: hypothetical protein K2H96_02725 [Muribaculaceae bacterium]|nr:hypothetical protein [Muribaculaceae bacterium]
MIKRNLYAALTMMAASTIAIMVGFNPQNRSNSLSLCNIEALSTDDENTNGAKIKRVQETADGPYKGFDGKPFYIVYVETDCEDKGPIYCIPSFTVEQRPEN